VKLHPNKTAALVIVALLTTAFALFLRFGGSKPLSYQGHPIDYWFARLPLTVVTTNGTMRLGSLTTAGQKYGDTNGNSQALAAFDSFGTTAIPFLLAKFQDEDSWLENKTAQVALKFDPKSRPFRIAQFERAQSVSALIQLGEIPPDASRTLAHLTNNALPEIARSAKYLLSQPGRTKSIPR
jgi:hypothetical protein